MHTFPAAGPITIEIRQASGSLSVDLTETDSTEVSVEVAASSGHPLGFLNEMLREFAGGRERGDWSAFFGGKGTRDRSTAPDVDSAPEKEQHAETTGEPPRDPADDVIVEFRESVDNGTLIIDAERAQRRWHTGFAISVTAPSRSHLRTHLAATDLRISGIADRLDVRTASGDVFVDEVAGRALVNSASGDVRISRVGADIEIRTASGDIDLGPVSANALLHTTSGDVVVAASTGHVNARSVSGDVRVADAESGKTEIVAVTGDVEVGIHAGSRASVRLHTLRGRTRTDLPVATEAPEGDAPGLDLSVDTTSGDILLRRAG